MKSVALIMGLCCSVASMGQAQHNNWYFGQGAALSFAGGGPVSIASPMWTGEGCASISDADGALLFYTNGRNVWANDQSTMPNGFDLFGQSSSTQTALIVPFPASDSLYYIFTVPAEVGTETGGSIPTGDALHYSIVDMSLNGGLGDVTIKNEALDGPMTEKLTATRHANGRDVWVLCHTWGTADYYAYRVSCEGIAPPVISTVGRVMGFTSTNNHLPAIGCMRVSPQGDRLAAAWIMEYGFGNMNGLADILEFDNATGVLSAAISMNLAPADSSGYYGVAFSPNGSRLYLSGGDTIPKIYQYDMSAADIPASQQVVASNNTMPGFATMQLAPDGALYISRSSASAPYLSKITAPNALGLACGYVSTAVSLTSGNCTFGLPQHWDSYPDPPIVDLIPFEDSTRCSGTVLLDATFIDPEPPSYRWNTGSTDPAINVGTSGLYTVEVSVGCVVYRDTVMLTIGSPAIDLGPDQRFCEGQTLTLSVPDDGLSILWSDGSMETEFDINELGLISVTVTDSLGCMASDDVLIHDNGCRCDVYVPNSFTPNGDGINDVFALGYECDIHEFSFSVHDRWGNELFLSDDPDFRWEGKVDGTELPSTILVWTMDRAWTDVSGSHRSMRQGSLTLLR